MATVSARSAWWLAIRPATLTASAAPVLVGTGAALLIIDRKRRGSGPKPTARLRFGVHPRGVALSGSF